MNAAELLNLGGDSVTAPVRMVLVLTLITLAPALILGVTSFVRIVVVFSFLRSALGVQSAPPGQVLTGLALFMTFAVMMPTGDKIYTNALEPFLAGKMPVTSAIEQGSAPLKEFMLRQTRDADLTLFYELHHLPRPKTRADVSLAQLVPAFMISELRTGFEMGFMLYVPFVLVDLAVAAILMALGMVMVPPALISLPIKLLLFVAADGWHLLVGSLVRSFG